MVALRRGKVYICDQPPDVGLLELAGPWGNTLFPSEIRIFCFTPRMPSRLAAFLMTMLLACAPAAFGSGKKEGKCSISFHMETDGNDNPKMVFPEKTVNGKPAFFRRMPEFSNKDVAAFVPFPSSTGGDDYGIVVLLKDNAAKRLMAVSNANQKRWMVAQVNGRFVDGVMIDKQIDDGKLVIWKGITLADIKLLEGSFTRAGQDAKKK